MQLTFRDMKCDEMYKFKINWITLNRILELMQNYKDFDKDPKHINNSVYVVFADCLGDLMGESSDAFYVDTVPKVLFIDPYSSVNQWVLVAHELIHYLQRYLYNFYDTLEEFEDMAYELQYRVRDILCNTKTMHFEFITDDALIIDNIIDQVKLMDSDSKVFAYEDADGTNYLIE